MRMSVTRLARCVALSLAVSPPGGAIAQSGCAKQGVCNQTPVAVSTADLTAAPSGRYSKFSTADPETPEGWQSGNPADGGTRISTRGRPTLTVAQPTAMYTRGVPTLSFKAVGMLLRREPSGELSLACTAALTQPDTLLSAGHCLAALHARETLWSYFPYEGFSEVDLAKSELFCTRAARTGNANVPDGCSPRIDDLAMLKLKTPYLIIRPEQLQESPIDAEGAEATIAGFGSDNEPPFEYGIMRGTGVTLEECRVIPEGYGEAGDTRKIAARELCFTFDGSNPSKPGITPFDSGGPMYWTPTPGVHGPMIGVARGSAYADYRNSDLQEAKYVDLTNPFYAQWLEEKVFSDAPTKAAYAVEDLKVVGLEFLSPIVNRPDIYEIELTGQPVRIIVTLNHEPGSQKYRNNLDLVMSEGLTASCDRHQSVEVCRMESPQAGTHTVKVAWSKSCARGDYCANPIYEVAYQMRIVALYDVHGSSPVKPPVGPKS